MKQYLRDLARNSTALRRFFELFTNEPSSSSPKSDLSAPSAPNSGASASSACSGNARKIRGSTETKCPEHAGRARARETSNAHAAAAAHALAQIVGGKSNSDPLLDGQWTSSTRFPGVSSGGVQNRTNVATNVKAGEKQTLASVHKVLRRVTDELGQTTAKG